MAAPALAAGRHDDAESGRESASAEVGAGDAHRVHDANWQA